jgi:hypothetical protein
VWEGSGGHRGVGSGVEVAVGLLALVEGVGVGVVLLSHERRIVASAGEGS